MKAQQVIECHECKWRITMNGSNNLKKLGGPPTWDLPSLRAYLSMIELTGTRFLCRFCGNSPIHHAITELESDSESPVESAAASAAASDSESGVE